MCYQCWDSEGNPQPDAVSSAAVPLVEAVYGESRFGGNLHIILDDWNIEDDDLAYCRGLELTPAEDDCLTAFEAMSQKQRAACLAEQEELF